MCARTVNGSEQLSYWCSRTLTFLDWSSMLHAAHVTNAFLSYTGLTKCFFSDVFFTSWLHFYFTGSLIMYWWKRTPCVAVYLKVLLSQKMNWVSSISFLHSESKKIKFLKTFWNLDNKISSGMLIVLIVINRVGVLISNPPAIQFSFKFEFILCKNYLTSYQDIEPQLLVVHSAVWIVFPGIVLNQRIHIAVLMLKLSFNF